MRDKLKLGTKVRILWDKTDYVVTENYNDVGEVKGYAISHKGTPLVVVYNFHKYDKQHSLRFLIDEIRSLREVVKDGDTL